MNKIIKAGCLVLVATSFVACGVNTEDYNNAVAERDAIRAQLTEKAVSLTRVTQELEVKKRELATEIRVKQAHAVREEQAKQRLAQAERDLAAALRELSAYKGKKK